MKFNDLLKVFLITIFAIAFTILHFLVNDGSAHSTDNSPTKLESKTNVAFIQSLVAIIVTLRYYTSLTSSYNWKT